VNVDVCLPQWGMAMQEGTVLSWLRQVGENVAEDDVLALVEAAKVEGEVIAPVSGRLCEIRVPEGEVAAVGDVLAVIDEPD
jgi:pyruvate/2-oxoglutarate dehydrogenase complex dihydrolipoamide acyltransferase (E2) component